MQYTSPPRSNGGFGSPSYPQYPHNGKGDRNIPVVKLNLDEDDYLQPKSSKPRAYMDLIQAPGNLRNRFINLVSKMVKHIDLGLETKGTLTFVICLDTLFIFNSLVYPNSSNVISSILQHGILTIVLDIWVKVICKYFHVYSNISKNVPQL